MMLSQHHSEGSKIAAGVLLINVEESALPSHWHFICHSCYKYSVRQKSLLLERDYSTYMQ